MHFCSQCKNMYYLKIQSEDSNKLLYYCRNCGNEDTELNTGDVCVLKTKLHENQEDSNHIINEYTYLDPTLPRTSAIKCPSQECPTNLGKIEDRPENEIIYLRYDDTNVKYLYLCAHCNTTWKTSGQS